MSPSTPTVAEAYRACRRIARSHYENFPVAARLVPRGRRDALAAIYAFARAADDVADEPTESGSTAASRLQALSDWRRKLDGCFAGQALHPIFIALGDAAKRYHLRRKHFEGLLCAFEMDVRQNRHADFASLLKYCSYSAHPVGRLVLELFGHHEEELFALADNITTALQLTNFWQDVGQDLDRDRVYLPLEDLRRFGLTVEQLKRLQAAPRSRDRAWLRWQELMSFQISRTREFFDRGRPLAEKVVPALRRQLRLTWLGGTAILSKIEAVRFDVFRRRPKLGALDLAALYFRSRRPLNLRAAGPGAAMTVRP